MHEKYPHFVHEERFESGDRVCPDNWAIAVE